MPKRIALVIVVILGSAAIGIGLASKAGVIDLDWRLALPIGGAVIAAGYAYDYAVRRSRKDRE
jgi:1,4-dihydroxy-2-naphthoate octaprenyltransferase